MRVLVVTETNMIAPYHPGKGNYIGVMKLINFIRGRRVWGTSSLQLNTDMRATQLVPVKSYAAFVPAGYIVSQQIRNKPRLEGIFLCLF